MPSDRHAPVDSAELVGLVTRVEELATAIDATEARLRRAPDEATRRVGNRLDEAAELVRAAAREIAGGAEDLTRIQSWDVPGRQRCGGEWGVCPEHGNTLVSSGRRSWCKTPGCGRSWDWDRGGLPCTEPAAYRIRGRADATGRWGLACEGHALAARRQVVDVQVVRLGDDGGDWPDAG